MKVIYIILLAIVATGLAFFVVVNVSDATRKKNQKIRVMHTKTNFDTYRLQEIESNLKEKNAQLEAERQEKLKQKKSELEKTKGGIAEAESQKTEKKLTTDHIVKTGFLQNGALVVPKKIGEIELLRPSQFVNRIYFLEEKINGVDYWVFGPNQYVEPVKSVYVEYIYNIQKKDGITTGILNSTTFGVTEAISFDMSYSVEIPFGEREYFADFLIDYKRITGNALDVSGMEIGIYHQQKEDIANGSSLSYCDDDRVDVVINTKKLKKSGREGNREDWMTSWRFTLYHELTHDILNLDHWFREHGAPTDNLLGTSAYPRFYLDSAYRDSLLTAVWTNSKHPNICHKN